LAVAPLWRDRGPPFGAFGCYAPRWARGGASRGAAGYHIGVVPTTPVNPPSVFSSLDHGFSQGAIATGSRTLYVSGQVAWDAEKRLIGGADLASQARQAFANLRTVVEAAGATLTDVAIVRIYVVDYRLEKAGAVGTAFRDCFAGVRPPASTWIGVAALADPELLIEVEAVAVF